jgi:hypothetical protein
MLYDYYYYKNIFDEKSINEINEIAINNKSQFHKDNGAFFKKVNCFVVEKEKFKTKLNVFYDLCIDTNRDIFGFEIFGLPKTINYNQYNAGHEYGFHRDSTENGYMSDTKLTAIVNLSTVPYTGGDFEMIIDGGIKKVEEINAPGSMIIFPSFLYHRVTPVTSGKRITMSAWFNGPNWK